MLILQVVPTLTAVNEQLNSFFTTESFATFAGATAITFVVSNGIQKAFNYNPKWLALVIAVAVCETAVIISKATDIPPYLIAILNGFLVYSAAGGITAMPGQFNPDKSNGVSQDTGKQETLGPLPSRTFWSSWF